MECYKRATAERRYCLTPDEYTSLLACDLGFKPASDVDTVGASDSLTLYLELEAVRILYKQLTDELKKYPILAEAGEGAMRKLHQAHVGAVENNTAKLANTLQAYNIYISTLGVLQKYPSLYTSIKYAQPTFDETCIKDMSDKVKGILKEIEDLLVAFRNHMPKHPRFKDCSAVFVAQTEAYYAELLKKLIRDWSAPFVDSGRSIGDLACMLHAAQGSLVYDWVWHRQCESEQNLEVSPDPKKAMEQWKTSVQRSFNEWRNTTTAIENKSILKIDLEIIFADILGTIPETGAVPKEAIQASAWWLTYGSVVRKHFETNVQDEIAYTTKVLGVVNNAAINSSLVAFMSAVSFQTQAQAIEELAVQLQCPYDDNQVLLGRYLHAMRSEESTAENVLTLFGQMQQTYPKIFNIVGQFPQLLSKLLKEGLHVLLKQHPDPTTLSQVVQRKTGEAGQREQILLNALLDVRHALETSASVNGYLNLLNTQFTSLPELLLYLANVSWSATNLRSLGGGIGKLTDLLQGGASVASTVELVHQLITTGEFAITACDLEVNLTATALVDKDGVLNLRSFTSAELDDIPFQLCMVGDQRVASDDLPIRRHFLELMEHLKLLGEAVLKLTKAGHPDYEECSLKMKGSISLETVKKLIKEQGQAYSTWQTFLSSYADVHLPLLTCLSRSQLVESLRYIGRPKYATATANLLRTVCPSLSFQDALQLVHRSKAVAQPVNGADGTRNTNKASKKKKKQRAKKAAQTRRSKKIFSSVHDLLLAAREHIVPPAMSASTTRPLLVTINKLLNSLPARLAPSSTHKVNMLKLPASFLHNHSEIIAALYLATKKRLPSSIEVLSCSTHTTEQTVVDFLRRWAAAHFFSDMLPATAQDLLFCMVNTEQLSVHIQSVVITQLHHLRRTVGVPLLLVASADHDTDCLLASGMRGEWAQVANVPVFLADCLKLCTAYLQKERSSIQVYCSDTPSSGKSTKVLQDHAAAPFVPGAEPRPDHEPAALPRPRPPYAMVSITGDADEAVEVLRTVECDRRLWMSQSEGSDNGNNGESDSDKDDDGSKGKDTEDEESNENNDSGSTCSRNSNISNSSAGSSDSQKEGKNDAIVLHLNVSSHFDELKLNRFLMSFLVTGVLADSKGNCVVRNAVDTIAIEWPSEGVLANNAWSKCQLLSCFAQNKIQNTLQLATYNFELCNRESKDSILHYVTSQVDERLSLGVQMSLAFFQVNKTDAFDSMPYCEDIPKTELPEPVTLFKAFSDQLVSPTDPNTQPSAGQVHRFVRFLAHQMYGLAKLSYYQFASKETEESQDQGQEDPRTHCRNYRRLAFHFAHSSLELAKLLAASAVAPLVTDTYDDTRLSNLQFSFDSWKKMPFLIFSESGEYEIISVAGTGSCLYFAACFNTFPHKYMFFSCFYR
jgi:hypothetical protein